MAKRVAVYCEGYTQYGCATTGYLSPKAKDLAKDPFYFKDLADAKRAVGWSPYLEIHFEDEDGNKIG